MLEACLRLFDRLLRMGLVVDVVLPQLPGHGAAAQMTTVMGHRMVEGIVRVAAEALQAGMVHKAIALRPCGTRGVEGRISGPLS